MKPQGDANTCEHLIRLFSEIPPDRKKIEDVFSQYTFSKEQLAKIAVALAQDCFMEYSDALDDRFPDITPDHMNSNHLLESLQQLLNHGLDPNICVGEDADNVMWSLQFVNAPNIGASAMRLLLENGADPNRKIPPNEVSIFDDLDFSVYDNNGAFAYMVQCWLVLMAYGGRWENGNIPLTMLNGNKVEIFKDFEYFDYSVEPLKEEPKYSWSWLMRVYDMRTHEEVARY